MTLSRRTTLGLLATAAGGVAAAPAVARTVDVPTEGLAPGRNYRPVISPNATTLPFRIVDGTKVFHLIAEPVEHEFAPGLKAKCWGYNGRVHGPTIEAVEGDRVRIYVTNRLPAPTTIHWHGMLLPNGMDGVGGLTQPSIPPGETFIYEWVLRQHGTLMYHPHHDEMTQMGLGLMGLFIVHPRAPREPLPDRDYALLSSEWSIPAGASRPNPNEMTDFNILTLNGRCFPATEPMVAERGERVRIRFGNLSMMSHHAMHIHGVSFWVTQTDGGIIPPSARWPETTILVPTGSTRTVEFVPDLSGDWAIHCHMLHHVMNQMGHDGPNMVGADFSKVDDAARQILPGYMTMGTTGMADMGHHLNHMPQPANSIAMKSGQGPFGEISMGGMVSMIKVRDKLSGNGDPGWYAHPKGTVSRAATAAELKRDKIEV